MSTGSRDNHPHPAAPNLKNANAGAIVIVGGSGFLGSNLAHSFLREGEEVVVIDNLSRTGVERNLAWLISNHGEAVQPVIADIRDFDAIQPALSEAKAVFHFAAQTAVTTSLEHPLDDFETNARGTLNILEAVRGAGRCAPVIFASTNKVYGALGDIGLKDLVGRHMPVDPKLRERGIDETRPLDLHTPYGCSKGVADQYVLDYARSFALKTAVLRMSCIYGPRQCGTEDQGWVAHFLMCAIAGKKICIYGDGKQVRDVLHVDDAIAAYKRVLGDIDVLSGRAFNLGGGPANAVSIAEIIAEIERLPGCQLRTTSADWRAGDQLYFVADTTALAKATGWTPQIGWQQGLRDLHAWLLEEGCAKEQRHVQPRSISA